MYMDILLQALRQLLRERAYAVMVIAVMSLGLSVAIVMYSVLRAVVLAGLPYADAERVVALSTYNARLSSEGALTTLEARALEAEPGPFEVVSRYYWGGATVVGGERPREITVSRVAAGFFDVLRPTLLLGRGISPADVAQDRPVIVLSHAEWRRQFGGDPGAIGRQVKLSDGEFEVIGVLPPEFQFPAASVGAWMVMPPRFELGLDVPQYRYARFVAAVGRLRPGVDATQALAHADALWQRLRVEQGVEDEGWALRLGDMLDELLGDSRQVLWTCFGIALLVLGIACTNTGLLLHARLLAQSRSHAVAMALGASRRRLAWQSAIEVLYLCGLSAVLALLLSKALLNLFGEGFGMHLQRGEAIAIDAGVVLAAALFSLLAAVLALAFGLRLNGQASAATRSSRNGLGERRAWLRVGPTLGVALSTVALVAAAALGLSVHSLTQVDPGYRTEGVQVVQLFRDGEADEWRRFAELVHAEIARTPGIESIAHATAAPLSLIGSMVTDVAIEGRGEPEPYQMSLHRVSPEYADVLQLSTRRGRWLQAQDSAEAERVVVINETLARRSFADRDPLGQILLLPTGEGPREAWRIVGVVADIRNQGPREAPEAEAMIPFAQSPWMGISFIAHSRLPAAQVQQAMEDAVLRVAPEEAVTRRYALVEDLHRRGSLTLWFSQLLLGFGVAAVLLAAFGVYALLRWLERSRRAEMGLRLAVGAAPVRLVGSMLYSGLGLSLQGFAIGGCLAWFALRLLDSQLYGLGAESGLAFATAGLAMLTATILASLRPSLALLRLDPTVALRGE